MKVDDSSYYGIASTSEVLSETTIQKVGSVLMGKKKGIKRLVSKTGLSGNGSDIQKVIIDDY